MYLSDFGLAKPAHSTRALTRQGSIVARVEYVAPEQILNQRVDARADIYALGCVLFEALTAEPPSTDRNQGLGLLPEANLADGQVGGDPHAPSRLLARGDRKGDASLRRAGPAKVKNIANNLGADRGRSDHRMALRELLCQWVDLSPIEYELLKVFVSNPDRVLTHHWLLQHVWGPQYSSEGNYLHVYVARLRKKIEADPQLPRHLLTEPGVGYRFVSEPG